MPSLTVRRVVRRFFLICLLLMAMATPVSAIASTWTVTSLADDGGAGEFRQALTSAMNGDTITFAPGLTGTITLTSQLPLLTDSIAIQGPGPDKVSIDGNGFGTIFYFTASATVSISGLTLERANDPFGSIQNYGTLTITNCVITRNYADGSTNSTATGGISNEGILKIIDSTISGNSAVSNAYAVGGISSTVDPSIPRALTLINSSVLDNSARGGRGSTQAGGIYSTGEVYLINSTVTKNSINGAASGAGGIADLYALSMLNSIVAGNNVIENNASNDPDIALTGGYLTGGYFSIVGNLSPLDNSPRDPGLVVVKNSAGVSLYAIPLPGSLAICSGFAIETTPRSDPNFAPIPARDPRGVPRPYNYGGTKCIDAGAVQSAYTSVQFLNGASSTPNFSGSINTPITTPAAPQVSITENGAPLSGVPISLSFSGSGNASGLGPVTSDAAHGSAATFDNIRVDQSGLDDTLSTGLVPIFNNSYGAYSLPATSASLAIGYPTPTITLIAPPSGPSAGRTSVVIAGTGFDGATIVDFGGVASTFAVNNPTQIIATSPAHSPGTVDITVTNPGASSTATPADQFTYTSPITLSPDTLPPAHYGEAYMQTMQATGGTLPYSYAVVTGALPPGLTLNPQGPLSGTPTTTGTFPFTVRVTDSTPYPNTVDRSYTMQVLSLPLHVAVANASFAFGDPYPVLTGTPTGLIPSDTAASVGLSYATTTPTNSNSAPGTYPITAHITSPNYTLEVTGGTLTITKATATIALSNLNQSYTGSPRTVVAITTPANLTTNITYNGSPTPPAAAGSYSVVATIQDENYTVTASGTLTITKAQATVALSNLNQPYTGSPRTIVAITTPANLTTNITYNGSPTPPTAAGTYSIVATVQDSNYSGTASGTLTIGKATATVALVDLNQPYTGAPRTVVATTTPANLATSITYNGSPTPPTAAGTYSIVATVQDSNYSGTASGTLTIGKATAIVALADLSQSYTGSPRTAVATTTPANLATSITYNGSPTPPTAAGTYSIVATVQDTNYSGTASGTLTIGKATATVALADLNQPYTGSPRTVVATTTPANLATSITYNGSPTPPTAAGSYSVVAAIQDSNYSGTVSGTLTIGKATATVALSNLNQSYTGSPRTVVAITTPANLATSITYNGSPTAPAAAGSYSVVATIQDENYIGTASGTLTVGRPTLTATANDATKVYGTPNPAFSGTLTGQQGGDTFTETFSSLAQTASPVGTYTITPGVSGANLDNYTQSIQPGTLTVAKAGSLTSFSTDSTSITPNQTVTLSAAVASATTGVPTGTIRFNDGATVLGTVALTNGRASLSSALSPGLSHVLTATYSGDGNFNGGSASSSVAVAVAPLDFVLTPPSPLNQTVIPGQTATFSFSLNPLYGSYADAITFSATGLPPGATATFSPSSLPANSGPQTVTLTVRSAPATAHNEAGSALRYAATALLLLPLIGIRKRKGMERLLQMALLLVGSAACTALLSGCGTSNGYFAQPERSYNVTVTATSGGLQHSATVTVVVQ